MGGTAERLRTAGSDPHSDGQMGESNVVQQLHQLVVVQSGSGTVELQHRADGMATVSDSQFAADVRRHDRIDEAVNFDDDDRARARVSLMRRSLMRRSNGIGLGGVSVGVILVCCCHRSSKAPDGCQEDHGSREPGQHCGTTSAASADCAQ